MQEPAQTLVTGLSEGAKRLMRLAISALARREHSRVEIERKLQRQLREADGETPADITLIVDRLQARGLLSDQRMAQALVRTRSQRYGRLRILQELQRRGVDRETIAAALPATHDDSLAARTLWQRKFGKAPTTPLERARQGRFLAARGFAPALIARILTVGEDESVPESSETN